MSKQSYIVNCYTCQHNGQETCRGCKTLLVGEDEPYDNWQLREDLEQKDNKIADLETKLAESEWAHNSYFEKAEATISFLQEQFNEKGKIEEQLDELKQQLAEYEKFMKDNEWDSIEEMQETLNKCEKKYYDIQEQLAEKDKELLEIKQRIAEKASKEFQEMLDKRGNHNQDKISFAVEQLEKVKAFIEYKRRNGSDPYDAHFHCEYLDAMALRYEIDNQIKQLKER